MRNFYIGWSRADLETALRAAQEELAAGSVASGGAAGDASFQRFVDGKANIEERIANLLYSLYLIDPVAYPARDCNPTRRTQVMFRDWNASS